MKDFVVSSYLSDKVSAYKSAADTDIFGEDMNIEQLMIEVSRDFSRSHEFYSECITKAVSSNGLPFLDYFLKRNCSLKAGANRFDCSLTAMIGRSGCGKSVFLRWWRKQFAADNCFILDIEKIRTAYSLKPECFEKFITDYFCESIRDYFLELADDEQELINSNLISIVGELSDRGITAVDSGFLRSTSRPEGNLPLLGALISALSTGLDKPLWFLVDNVELENPVARKSIIIKFSRIYSKLIHEAEKYGREGSFNFLLTLRPETYHEVEGKSSAASVISYPCQDTASLFIRKMESSIRTVFKKYGYL